MHPSKWKILCSLLFRRLIVTSRSVSKINFMFLTQGGLLYIFWVRGRAIGKGIDFHDFDIRNGYRFSQFWYKEWY